MRNTLSFTCQKLEFDSIYYLSNIFEQIPETYLQYKYLHHQVIFVIYEI